MPNIPMTMTTVAIREPGGPEALVLDERRVPTPRDGQLLVRVAAAGVNRPDVMQRQGGYPPPPGAPDTPGLEIAGEVVATGPGAHRFHIGDHVCALVPGGGYAEYCLAHWSNALPIPEGLSLTEAAGLPETYFTVWHNVFQRGALMPGETLLVHGGTSGIGTTAIQLGKSFGAKVIVTAGSEGKCEACRKLGADIAINYRESDFVKSVKEATDGHGADVILDMVGGDYVSRNYAAAAEDGRIVQIAFLRGTHSQADFLRLMLKRLTHTGSTMRPRPVSFKAGIARELEDRVWPLFASGQVRPVMDSTFPLRDAPRAHARMEEGRHIGKIVLETGL